VKSKPLPPPSTRFIDVGVDDETAEMHQPMDCVGLASLQTEWHFPSNTTTASVAKPEFWVATGQAFPWNVLSFKRRISSLGQLVSCIDHDFDLPIPACFDLRQANTYCLLNSPYFVS
jgi:hypothetical protein